MHEVVSIWIDKGKEHVVIREGESVKTLFSDYDLIQYTGKKDKNGVYIYDGDLCQAEYSGADPDLIYFGEVKFDESCFIFCNAPLAYYEEIEVKGNKFEHPDLFNMIGK